MSIYKSGSKIANIYKGGTKIAKVYKGLQLLYSNEAKSLLPDGYIELDYITPNNTNAYIDLGYYPNQNTKVDILAKCDKELGVAFQVLYGTQKGPNEERFVMLWGSSNNTQYGYNNSSSTTFDSNVNNLPVYNHYILSKELAEIQGVKTSAIDAKYQTDFTCSYSLYLFARNNAGTAGSFGLNAYIKSAQVYENSTLIRNMLPCMSPSGEYGMYDLANSGKNLFDWSSATNTGIADDRGSVSTLSTRLFSDYIKVKPNNNYYFSTTAQANDTEEIVLNRIVEYDKDKKFLRRIGSVVNKSQVSYTPSSDCKYIVLDFRTPKLTTNLTKEIIKGNTQLEEGSTATEYEPYPFYGNANTEGSFTGRVKPNKNYTFYDYLESDGKAYINTGHKGYSTSGLAVTYLKTRSTNEVVIGTKSSGTNNGRLAINPTSLSYVACLYNTAGSNSFSVANEKHTATLNLYNKGVATCDNQSLSFTKLDSFEGTSLDILIFATTWGSNTPAFNFQGKIYNAQITEEDKLVRYFIPAQRNSDKVNGMYDIVQDEFFINANTTGEFTVGNE